MPKSIPFSPDLLQTLAAEHGTPLWVYDAETIQRSIQRLRSFDTIRFAQKACSNIHILSLMRTQGVKVDAVSRGEILRALAAGYESKDSNIVFTADLLDEETLKTVLEHRVPVNAGSIDMLDQLGNAKAAPHPHPVWLRINPGFGHGHSNKTNTGGEHSKHGIWHEDLGAALNAINQHGLDLVGLHMHIGSGVDYEHLAQVCGAMVNLVRAAHELGHSVRAISAGGGLSIPYRTGEAQLDTDHYFSLWDSARCDIEALLGHSVELEIEPGRFLVAQAGVLLAQVRATKNVGKNHFVLVDAGFNELVRPAMYGSWHEMHLQRDGKNLLLDLDEEEIASVVAGPLCESGDVFTQGAGEIVQPRLLGRAQVGDLLVIHDTGAYGASMSSNYNSRPLAAEVLVDLDGAPRLIRRRQSVEELLALELL